MQSRPLVCALLALFLFIIPVSGAGITRVVTGNDTASDVRLIVESGGPVFGITEVLPAGSRMASCSLPSDQYRLSEDHLNLVLIGEEEVSYTLEDGAGAGISGTWTDFSDGSQGAVADEGHVPPTLTGTPVPAGSTPTSAPGFGLGIALTAFCIVAFQVYQRRNGS
jgi:hypothetical protein